MRGREAGRIPPSGRKVAQPGPVAGTLKRTRRRGPEEAWTLKAARLVEVGTGCAVGPTAAVGYCCGSRPPAVNSCFRRFVVESRLSWVISRTTSL